MCRRRGGTAFARDVPEPTRRDAAETGAFLGGQGEQLRGSNELTLATEEWELLVALGEPVTLEADLDGVTRNPRSGSNCPAGATSARRA